MQPKLMIKMLRNFSVIFRSFETRFSTTAENAISNVKDFLPNVDDTMKLLKVSVIGVPNAGKSSFINCLMDRKVCPTSSKVHTTRKKTLAVFTEGDSQIVFLDTPGLVSFKEHRKFNLERSFLKDSKSSLQDADIIGVIHDSSNIWTREQLDIKVIHLLEEHKNKPSFLVFNKVDLVRSKRKLLDLTRIITENCIDGKPIPNSKPFKAYSKNRGWPYFQEVFMVSALTGSGLGDVKNYLIKQAKPEKWMFSQEIWSDEAPEEIILKSVKARLLDYLPQEIPYTLTPEMEYFDIDEKGIISTVVLVHCSTERIAKLVGGVSDGKLRQMTESVQNDLQDAFRNHVRVKLVLDYPNKQ